MKTWVIVADASRARIFEVNPTKDGLQEIHAFVHPGSRMKTSELVSDRPGRVDKGPGHAAMEARTSAHDVQANEFANILALELDRAVERGECSSIMLVVPPRFLGRLRSSISHRVFNAIIKTLPKELTHCSTAELSAALAAELPASAGI